MNKELLRTIINEAFHNTSDNHFKNDTNFDRSSVDVDISSKRTGFDECTFITINADPDSRINFMLEDSKALSITFLDDVDYEYFLDAFRFIVQIMEGMLHHKIGLSDSQLDAILKKWSKDE